MQGRLKKFRTFFPVILLLAASVLTGCDQDTSKPSSQSMAPTTLKTAPTATISATPSSIAAGDLVTIEWQTTDASSVNISGIGSVPASGKKTVSPPQTTTYRLVAKGSGGRAEAATVVTILKTPPIVVIQPPPTQTPSTQTPEQEFATNVVDIYFDYDAYDVRTDSQTNLSKDAAYLVNHPNINIIIAGYCDERGSNEYNVALGENRANSVKDALVSSGVAATRIKVVSFGKEQPFCADSTEECWQQNRRAGIKLDIPSHD
jgi:peptidoglycan-associated lipoprotein